MRWFWLVLLVLSPCQALASAPDSVAVSGHAASGHAVSGDTVTGYLHGDLLLNTSASALGSASEPALAWTWEEGEAVASKRSVPLALVLSAALPGAGQAYNRSWVRAAVYAGLEVALWAGYVSWRGQGLDSEDAFQAQAHVGWSPERYGAWLRDYDGFGGDPAPLDAALEEVARVDFETPSAWSDAEASAVRRLVGAIRAAEDESRYANGAAFSHVLPFFGDQQYYELIGKYAQFNPGWEDYARAYPTGEIPVNAAAATEQFLEYADLHDEANDYLRRASRVTAVIVVNHVLSAFDAMLTARLHNLRLDSDLALVPDARGDLTPVASVRLQF